MKRIELPEAVYLRSNFIVYNGVLCRWPSLEPSGKIYEQGYSRTNVNRRGLFDHRLVFKMAHGYCPDVVDHIDGNKANNSISNLREASSSQNQFNCRIRDTELPFKGVYLDKRTGRYGARIRKGNKMTYLGMYSTGAEAAIRYDEAAVEMFGDFAKTNKSMGAY